MSTSFKISIIGSGNVAFHLTHHFIKSGHHINSIYTRQAKKWMDELASIPHKKDLDYKDEYADFIILAIKDEAVSKVLSQLKNVSNAQLLHTSGTLGIDVFKDHGFDDGAILYPFQTIQRSRAIDMSTVNYLLEAPDSANEEKLKRLCENANLPYRWVNTHDRSIYHLAAVFSSNFINHLMTISKQILDDNQLDFDLLKPLIFETINKALALQPKYTQTGPAVREDNKIMNRHIEMLGDEDLKQIYRIMSDSIMKSFKPVL